MHIFIPWLLSTASIIITSYLLPGVHLDGFLPAMATAVVIGLINTFIKPILLVFTLPINVLSLGLFTLVINALLIMLASWMVPGFNVENFGWALLFSIVLFFVNYGLGLKK